MRRGQRRKPREAPPPHPYVVSNRASVGARIKKTGYTRDGLWLYRLDYGNIVGTQEWTLPELKKIVTFRKNPPFDYRVAAAARAERKAAAAAEKAAKENAND